MADLVFNRYRKDGGWGVAPQEANLTVDAGDGANVLSWNVTEKIVVENQTICVTEGIVIRRSAEGYPKDENSGELVVKSTELSGTYTDEGLTNETTYYYRAFPYSDHGVYNREKYKSKGSAKPSVAAKLYLRFTASEAIGETIEATDGTNTMSATVDRTGQAFFEIYDAGKWTVGGQPFTAVLGVSTVWNEKLYGYDIDMDESDPESSVSYPSGVDNADFANVPACTATMTDLDLADWEDFTENFIGARPVMLTYDGEVSYELDHNDQTKKLDGTASDISSTAVELNAMVEFPKRYIKRYTDTDGKAKFRISRVKLNDAFKAYNWMYGDDEESAIENDVIYMPMFKGVILSNKMRSLAGQRPGNTTAGATEWTAIQALGSGWQFTDHADKEYLYDLMFLMGKSTNVQKHFGAGHNSGGSQASHLTTTGSLKDKGAFLGSTGNANNKFFWIEPSYGDRWDRTMGVYMKAGILYVKMFPPYTVDGNIDLYENLGRSITGASGGYISKYTYDKNGLIPSVVSGSETTYVPDGCWFNTADTRFLISGAVCNAGAKVGRAFHVSCVFSYSAWDLGASPAYKHPAA